MKKLTTNFGLSWRSRKLAAGLLAAVVFLSIGSFTARAETEQEQSFYFQPGDEIEVSFPGAPDLNRSLRIRRDGIATFPLIGEVSVEGLTTGELESQLKEKYEGQLVTNEVMVAVLNSSFSYYVEGAVNSPGKVVSFRALTALEAVLEAGGYTEISKIDSVKIIRRKKGKYETFKVDLQRVLNGRSEEIFPLEPNDIVSVPQKFW